MLSPSAYEVPCPASSGRCIMISAGVGGIAIYPFASTPATRSSYFGASGDFTEMSRHSVR
jgi:hypothetical protein